MTQEEIGAKLARALSLVNEARVLAEEAQRAAFDLPCADVLLRQITLTEMALCFYEPLFPPEQRRKNPAEE